MAANYHHCEKAKNIELRRLTQRDANSLVGSGYNDNFNMGILFDAMVFKEEAWWKVTLGRNEEP
jgi:hypothetical protein